MSRWLMGEAKTETIKVVRTRRTELNLTMLQLCTRDSCNVGVGRKNFRWDRTQVIFYDVSRPL